MPSSTLRPWHCALGVIALSLVLAWPMLVVSAPLVFFDTMSYLSMGEKTVAMAQSLLSAPDPAAAGGGGGAAAGEARSVRSTVYSLFLYLTSQSFLGLALPVLIQTGLALAMLLPFVGRVQWHLESCIALVVLLAFSTLPWTGSYAMPDILAAVILVWAAVMMRRVDTLDLKGALGVSLLATFAVSSHYGHIPLAGAMIFGVAVLRLLARRITWRFVVLAPLPVLIAVGLNMTASTIAFDAPSFAPKRLPILLARSLEDGPAAWYLEENCPDVAFTMCEVFGNEMPENITEFLWQPGGIKSVSPQTLEAIRVEEKDLLIEAFKAYPAAQLWSFGGNTLKQIVTVGTGDLFQMLPPKAGETLPQYAWPDADQARVLGMFDWITKGGTLVGLGFVLWYWHRGQLSQTERDLALIILVGLVVNALIFGGLSAPVDRYQSRVAWLLPALWFIHAARMERMR